MEPKRKSSVTSAGGAASAAPERRKKVTKACDYCKKRKYKCSGCSPCALCSKKKIECKFSIVDRRTTKGVKSKRSDSLSGSTDTVVLSVVAGSNSGLVANTSSSVAMHEKESSISLGRSNSIGSAKGAYIPKSLQPLLSFPLGEIEDGADDIEIDDNDNDEENEEIVDHLEETTTLRGDDDDMEVDPISHKPVIPKESVSISPTASFSSKKPSFSASTSSRKSEKSASVSSATVVPATGLSNNQGKSSRLLFDSAGNLRYIGESSPLSLLFECRNIFLSTIGDCEFTSDPQGINIIDEPGKIKNGIPVQLPKREHCNILVKFFESNVNSTWYIFNMRHFKEHIVDYIYDNPIRARAEKLVLLHLVLALGLLYAETSKSFLIEDLESSQINSLAFFESGCNLMRNTVDDGKLWLSEAYFLIYFYYQSTSKRSTSWIMLGTAIRNAQALGLHRKFINESFRDKEYIMHRRKLWRSLYVCDRISSILLGRPLLIGDYDWDDFKSDDLLEYEDKINHDKNIHCLIEIAKVCKINGKIVQNFYLDGIIDPARAEKLAIELKLWSINLPKELQLDRLLHSPENDPDSAEKNPQNYPEQELHRYRGQDDRSERFPRREMGSDNFALLLLHISQLYGIILLSKPFFMYIAFRRNNINNEINSHINKNNSNNSSNTINGSTRNETTSSTSSRRNKHEVTMINFCRASVKASVLTIQLVQLYTDRHSQRIESYTTVNCCFMASLILGLSIMHRKMDPSFEDEYNIALLMDTLNTAKAILSFYGAINATSHRFYKIVGKMQRSLKAAFGDMDNMIVSPNVIHHNNRDNSINNNNINMHSTSNETYHLSAVQQTNVQQQSQRQGLSRNNLAAVHISDSARSTAMASGSAVIKMIDSDNTDSRTNIHERNESDGGLISVYGRNNPTGTAGSNRNDKDQSISHNTKNRPSRNDDDIIQDDNNSNNAILGGNRAASNITNSSTIAGTTKDITNNTNNSTNNTNTTSHDFSGTLGGANDGTNTPTGFANSLSMNTDLESFMNFQQFFVPSVAAPTKTNEEFATQSTTSSSSGEPLDAFMYNMGTNDILFDGNI